MLTGWVDMASLDPSQFMSMLGSILLGNAIKRGGHGKALAWHGTDDCRGASLVGSGGDTMQIPHDRESIHDESAQGRQAGTEARAPVLRISWRLVLTSTRALARANRRSMPSYDPSG